MPSASFSVSSGGEKLTFTAVGKVVSALSKPTPVSLGSAERSDETSAAPVAIPGSWRPERSEGNQRETARNKIAPERTTPAAIPADRSGINFDEFVTEFRTRA